MKTFSQRLCSAEYDWNDLITNDCLEEWNESVKSLIAIKFISVPKLYCYYNTNDPVVTIELHGFCDASMKAYGCCVYLRFAHRSKFVEVVLVTFKSRIAPLHKQSIPKLELSSCWLLVRLIDTWKKEFKNFYDVYRPFLLLHTPGLWTQVRFFQCSFKTVSKKLEIWLTFLVLNWLIQKESNRYCFTWG